MPETPNHLTALLRQEIAAQGPMSFARFMGLALYHPVYGYYHRPLKQVGCQGDFYTSVSVGPLFGQLLAFRFASWLDRLGSPADASTPDIPHTFQCVEAGAHNGQLALDVLAWFEKWRPEQFSRLEYLILEPSEQFRHAQSDTLNRFGSKVTWFEAWDQKPASSIRGLIFCNELLDAMPVLRLGWNALKQHWFEWRVGFGQKFCWVQSPLNSQECEAQNVTSLLRSLPEELLSVLPQNFTIDISPAARNWWAQAAAHLQQGFLVTWDYGLEWEELFSPHRAQGTLRGYRSHQTTADPLDSPGTQDLTAHVNFSDIIGAGEECGLKTESFTSQERFITLIAAEAMREDSGFAAWNAQTTRQFQTLTHPDFLGRPFKALVQTCRVEAPN